ncbi:MAG: WD40 repeat domain-containing protein [Deltaproteobacteria bacterium]|nr:WD40 repeat domain-containing protein [Deltaproteobacteria bacterium]
MSVAWSPDGAEIATGSYFPDVLVWDPMTGDLKRRLEGHDKWLEQVVYSPDGRYLASGDWGETFILWDAKTGDEIRRFAIKDALEIIGLSFHPTKPMLAAGSFLNGVAAVVSIDTGEIVKEVRPNNPMFAAYSPDGRYIAFAGDGEGARINVFDAESLESVAKFQGHEKCVVALSFTDDGSKMLSCADDGTVRLWDFPSGKPLKVWDYGHYWVVFCSMIPGRDRFLTADTDGAVRLFRSIGTSRSKNTTCTTTG